MAVVGCMVVAEWEVQPQDLAGQLQDERVAVSPERFDRRRENQLDAATLHVAAVWNVAAELPEHEAGFGCVL